jgi:hypothetical protein
MLGRNSPSQTTKFPGKRSKFASKRSNISDSSSQKDDGPYIWRGKKPSAPSHSQRPKGRSENSWEQQDSVASGYPGIQTLPNHFRRPQQVPGKDALNWGPD